MTAEDIKALASLTPAEVFNKRLELAAALACAKAFADAFAALRALADISPEQAHRIAAALHDAIDHFPRSN